jgi:hypothetical protein
MRYLGNEWATLRTRDNAGFPNFAGLKYRILLTWKNGRPDLISISDVQILQPSGDWREMDSTLDYYLVLPDSIHEMGFDYKVGELVFRYDHLHLNDLLPARADGNQGLIEKVAPTILPRD